MADNVEHEIEQELETAQKAVDEAGIEAGKEALEKGLSEEEVLKRIEAARKEEKDKLYSRIESLESTLKDLRDVAKAEREEKDEIRKKAEEEAEVERIAKLSEEEKTQEKLKRFEEELAAERKQREDLAKKLEEEAERRELEAYKAQLLAEAGDEIIPELVQGNNAKDLHESVAYAKERFQQLFQASKQKAEGNVNRRMPGPTNPDPSALEEAELQESLAELAIDPNRYHRDMAYRSEIDQKREAILAKVGSAYTKSIRG